MSLLNAFMPKTEFSSYEDFKANFKVTTPDNFNFAYDVVDWYAAHEPDRRALVWCDDNEEHIFTFAEMKKMSDKAANMFAAAGIGKGDPVMLILKQRYEFWFCILALHKLGAITIPAITISPKSPISRSISTASSAAGFLSWVSLRR